jgi:hypothetical protein
MSSAGTNSIERSFSYQSAQQQAPIVRQFWHRLEAERNSNDDVLVGANDRATGGAVGGSAAVLPFVQGAASTTTTTTASLRRERRDAVQQQQQQISSIRTNDTNDIDTSISNVDSNLLHKSPSRLRTATADTAHLSDADCAREVHEPLMAMLLETGPFASDVNAMSVFLTVFGAAPATAVGDASNELVRAAVNTARRRGRDLALATSMIANELVLSLSRANGALDDGAIRAALGSLLRGNSPATKACRELLVYRCGAWLVRYVGSALHQCFAVLECDPAKATSPHAAASDLVRLENAAQQILSAILLAGASDLPDEAYVLAASVRIAVRYALELHLRSTARRSRREAFEQSASLDRPRRSSSAPRERGRKLASRRVVVAAEVERLRQQILSGDKSLQSGAALQRKELELIDIDRETDAIAVAPTAYMRESHFGRPDGRAFHVAMTGIFFLRFVCPALIAPQQFGLRDTPPPGAEQRTLLLLAKVIQMLANDAEFGRKEEFLAPLGRMHHRNREPLRRFFVYLAEEGQRRLARADAQPAHNQYGSLAAANAAPFKSASTSSASSHYQSIASAVGPRLPSKHLQSVPSGGVGNADDLADVALLVGELRRHLRQADLRAAPYNNAQWQRVAMLVGVATNVSVADRSDTIVTPTTAKPPAASAASAAAAAAVDDSLYQEIPIGLKRQVDVDAEQIATLTSTASDHYVEFRSSERRKKIERIRLLLGVKLNALRQQLEAWRLAAMAITSVADAMQHKKVLAALVELKSLTKDVAVLPDAAPFAMPALSAAQSSGEKTVEVIGKVLATVWLVDQRMQALWTRIMDTELEKDAAVAIADLVRQLRGAVERHTGVAC